MEAKEEAPVSQTRSNTGTKAPHPEIAPAPRRPQRVCLGSGELELVAPLRAPPSEVPPIAPKDLGRNVEGLKRHFQSSRPGVKVALNRRFNSRALKNRKSIVCGLSPGSVARR